MIQLDEVNTQTTKTILPGVVDSFFKQGPLVALAKNRFTRRWAGPQIQENFVYGSMLGGAYKKGATFNVNKPQTRTGMLFTPRYYQVNVTEFLEELEVEAVGPTNMFSMVNTDMDTAALTMSAILEIAFMRNGQDLTGAGGADRTAEINGLEEALTDATTATWDGNVFPTYGGQGRVAVSGALNSPIGGQAANVGGGIIFNTLMQSFLSCVIGGERPSIGITSNRAFGFIANSFHPQMRLDATEPEIDWPGIRFPFNKAVIVASQYFPGQDGVDDPILGDYADTTENLLWLNPGPQGDNAYLRFYIAQSAKYAFGFTGFKGARDDNQISGQVLFGGNLVYKAPRYSRILYGITQ